MATQPIAPIFAAPPQLECPVGPLRTWFTEPPGAVVQLTEATEFTVEMARWLVGPGFELLVERFQCDHGLLFVLDIRQMTSRQPVVRTVFMDRAREIASNFSQVAVIPPVRVKGVYLTALHAAAALVSAFGTQFDVTSDLDAFLLRHQIRVAT
jgi:hypothetical protein